MALKGQDPFKYRRLHRQLCYWFQPWDAYSARLVAELARDWWTKLNRPGTRIPIGQLRGQLAARALPRVGINNVIEWNLEILIPTLALRTRKWYYLLQKRFGSGLEPFGSVKSMRRQLETRLKSLMAIPGRIQVGEAEFLRDETARIRRIEGKKDYI